MILLAYNIAVICLIAFIYQMIKLTKAQTKVIRELNADVTLSMRYLKEIIPSIVQSHIEFKSILKDYNQLHVADYRALEKIIKDFNSSDKDNKPANRKPRTDEQKMRAAQKRKEWWLKKRQEQSGSAPSKVDIIQQFLNSDQNA